MNPYDIHSWSAQYRMERLHDARKAHLEARLREGRKEPSGRDSVGLALANVLSLVRGGVAAALVIARK
jgi:hypothetical protein